MKNNRRSLTKLDIALLGSGLAVTSVLSIGNMTRWSIWFDEAFSAMIVRHNFIDIARYTANDVHPPLYYWLLKLWTMVWGHSPLALRSLSLVLLLVAMTVVFVFVRRVFGRLAATVSLLLISIAPMLIRYSEEARMYTMTLAIVVAATSVLYEATRRPTRRKWLLYGILVGVGTITHYMTLIMWASHWLWRWYEVRQVSLRGQLKAFFSPEWRRALLVTLGVVALWLPLLLWQVINIQGGGFWIGPVSVDTLSNYLTNLYLYYDHHQVFSWLAVVLLALIALTGALAPVAYRQLASEEQRGYRLIISMAFLPPVILMLGSLPPLRPAFVDRYILAAILFWSVWVGITYAILLRKSGRQQKLVAGMLAATMVMSVMGIEHVYAIGNYNKDNNSPHTVRTIMELVDRETMGVEPVVAESSWLFFEVAYYETAKNPTFFRSEDSTKIGAYAMLRDDAKRKIVNTELFTKDYDKLWLVVRKDSIPTMSASFNGWRITRILQTNTKSSELRAVEMRRSGV